MERFYYREWKEAEKDGSVDYAENCKEHYRQLVMRRLIKPFHYYHDRLKAYPMINLN